MAQKFIGVTLPLRRGQTGMFDQSVTLLEQTRSNFKNLILTKKGERLAQTDTLGCDIWKFLFEEITDDVVEQARLSVVEAVENWLPYLELVNFEITPTADENKLNIVCTYRFRNNPNVTDTVVIPAPEL
jgi:phage baseplate assembly protein W